MEMEPRESQNRKPVRVWRMESCHHSQSFFWLVVSFSLSSFPNHYLPIWVAFPLSVYLTYSFLAEAWERANCQEGGKAKIWLICKLDNCSSSWSWVIECSAASCVQWMDWVHRLPTCCERKIASLRGSLFLEGRSESGPYSSFALLCGGWRNSGQFDFVEGRQ